MDTANAQHDRSYGNNITHLQVICRSPLENNIFIPFVKRLSNLCLLALTSPPSSAGLNIIQQHCPKLQQLYLSDLRAIYDTPDEISQQQQQQQPEGLRLLSLDGGSYQGDDIRSLMIHNCDTLESLVFQQGQFFVIYPTTKLKNDPVQFNQLRSFSYPYEFQHISIDFYEWIIRRAPNLESVEAVFAATQPHVLDRTLSDEGGPLRRIGLYCAMNEDQTEERHFLERHIQRGVASRLEHLKCILEREIRDDSWMYQIPQLHQLKTLEIAFTEETRIVGLGRFFERVSDGCRALEEVILKSKYVISLIRGKRQ